MRSIDRRAFLLKAGAFPLILGLAEGDDDPKAVFDRALARMKETSRWGVVLVPPTLDVERFGLAQALWAIAAFNNEDEDAHLLFCQAVFMVMPAEAARARFAAPAGTTRILLSPEGKMLASDAEPLSVVKDPARFAKSFRTFIYGASNSLLVDRAVAIRDHLAPELKAALSEIGSAQEDERLAALTVVTPRVEGITPLLGLIAEAGATDLARRRARNLLTSYFASQKEDALGVRVPYGCTGPHYWDPCPSCGRGNVPERSRMFLRFLGDPVPKRGK